ncbi:MAG: hypothetical protein LBQ80_01220 [Clostridium sp.]|jgi:hypothetical protein|nr:hypothetical protein [Clostridium sp.]
MMSKKKSAEGKPYIDRVHTWGTIWSVTALCAMLAVPLTISIYFNAFPQFSTLIKGLLSVLALYWATAVIEVITYAPMLGAGGTYLSFVSGNISNLKLPCGLAAMESAKVRANSEEGEVLSTIAIAASAITTTVVLAVGVLLFRPVLPYLTAEGSPFAPAFKQVLPALFGALGASYLSKHWRISILPLLVGVVILLFSGSMPVGTLLVFTVVASLVGAHVMYKLGWLGKEEKTAPTEEPPAEG